eukprot:g55392.t1
MHECVRKVDVLFAHNITLLYLCVCVAVFGILLGKLHKQLGFMLVFCFWAIFSSAFITLGVYLLLLTLPNVIMLYLYTIWSRQGSGRLCKLCPEQWGGVNAWHYDHRMMNHKAAIPRPSAEIMYSRLVWNVSSRTALVLLVQGTPDYSSLSVYARNTSNFFTLSGLGPADRTAVLLVSSSLEAELAERLRSRLERQLQTNLRPGAQPTPVVVVRATTPVGCAIGRLLFPQREQARQNGRDLLMQAFQAYAMPVPAPVPEQTELEVAPEHANKNQPGTEWKNEEVERNKDEGQDLSLHLQHPPLSPVVAAGLYFTPGLIVLFWALALGVAWPVARTWLWRGGCSLLAGCALGLLLLILARRTSLLDSLLPVSSVNGGVFFLYCKQAFATLWVGYSTATRRSVLPCFALAMLFATFLPCCELARPRHMQLAHVAAFAMLWIVLAFLVHDAAFAMLWLVIGYWHMSQGGAADCGPILRAVVAVVGLLALAPEEALYASTTRDCHGQPMRPGATYRINVPANQPAKWWSLTGYTSRNKLIKNEEERYSVCSVHGSNAVCSGQRTVLLSPTYRPRLRADELPKECWIANPPVPSDQPQTMTVMLRLYKPPAGLLARFTTLRTMPIIEPWVDGAALIRPDKLSFDTCKVLHYFDCFNNLALLLVIFAKPATVFILFQLAAPVSAQLNLQGTTGCLVDLLKLILTAVVERFNAASDSRKKFFSRKASERPGPNTSSCK